MSIPFYIVAPTTATVVKPAFTAEKQHMILAVKNDLIPTSLPFLEFTSAADYASVKALLDALPPRDARLLTLRYLENRSQRDTARALDMTQMQVHRAEKRLLALLRERLESK